jgi:serine/threonine protein kinase
MNDRYEVVGALGKGGMGIVYRAHDRDLQAAVAIKILRPQAVATASLQRRLRAEIRLARRINHPNVCRIYDYGRHGHLPYIVMEYVDGTDLRRALKEGGAPPPAQAFDVGCQIADALGAIHSAGVVHRDLKPANVMRNSSGQIKVMDFGIARSLVGDDSTHITTTGEILGTPEYMSPEQVRGERTDARSDLYALGLMLFEFFTGRLPLRGDDGVATALHQLQEPVRIDAEPRVPEALLPVLRKALASDPRARFQSAEDFRHALDLAKAGLVAVEVAPPRRRTPSWATTIAAVLATAALTAWIMWPQPERRVTLKRLTSDSGITTDPAISPDGKLVAYASDRAGEGDLDIWVQQTSGGEPLRITQEHVDEYAPSFSPDGSKIIFSAHSSLNDSDIYAVPALGGEPRLLVSNGCCGRYSPDGSRIAFLTLVGVDQSIAVIPATGGVPETLPRPYSLVAGPPIWSPDGRRLLAPLCHVDSPCDWFAISSDPRVASAPIKMGMAQLSQRYGLVPITAAEWHADRVVFTARSGDSVNLWSTAISPRTLQIEGPPSRLTAGSDDEYEASMDREGRTVFSVLRSTIDLWEIAADGNTAQRLTRDLGLKAMPSISDKGDKLVFVSDRLGNRDVWIRDVATGREHPVTETPGNEYRAVISHDGARVAYLTADGNKMAINLMSTAGGPPERVCDDCGAPADWFHDGHRLILQRFATEHDPATIRVLDLVSKQQSDLLLPGKYQVYRGHVSPDDRWMVVHAFEGNDKGSRVFVVPVGEGRVTGPQDWIPITDGSVYDDAPRWSPDGNSIYYLSSRDGSLCIWLQRVDPMTKIPVGAPIAVQHLHGKRQSISTVPIQDIDIAVSPDRIIFNMAELHGNIWMAEFK